MGIIIIGLGILLAMAIPLGVGWLAAGWLVTHLWPLQADSLFGWVLGMLTAVVLTLLLIAGWSLYRDKIWQGLMHPLAFMSSISLVLLALLALPSLWGQLRLLAEGETVVGTVESLSTGLDYDAENNITHTLYYLTYHFTTGDGASYRKRLEVSYPLYQSFSEAEPITIIYLPHRPSYSLPQTSIQPERRARRIFTYLGAVGAV
jgi:hypothetical protein